MARKTSDIALLLGSRGRAPARSGLGKFLHGLTTSWFGRSPWRSERPARGVQVPGWLAVAFAVVAFGGGYLIGGKAGPAAGKNDLRVKAPAATAGFVGEIDARPLHKRAFIVAVYPGIEASAARAAAKALADWLCAQKLDKARPYEYPAQAGPMWVVAVYFDGDAEMLATRDRLRALGDVPDETFTYYRNTRNDGEDWPQAWTVQ